MRNLTYTSIIFKYKWTIAGGLIGGGISHFYVLTNILQNHDSIAVQPLGYGTGVESGRWFLTVLGDLIGKLGGNYNLSWFNGITAILLLTISCCAITELFRLNDYHGFLFGAIFVAYPTVSSTFLFMYTSIYYAVAVCMSIFSVYLTERYKRGYIAATILIACSLGIYQAYFPMVAELFVILLIIRSLNHEVTFSSILKRSLYYLLTLISGFVLYFIAVKVCQNIYGVALNSYAGTGQITGFKLADIPVMLEKCYSSYYLLLIKEYYTINYNSVLKICFFIAQLGGTVLLVMTWKEKHSKQISIILSVVLYFFVFPLAVNGIEIMCYNSGRMYVLMVYATVFIFLLPFVLWDNLFEPIGNRGECFLSGWNRLTYCVHKILLSFAVITFLSYAYMANIKYTAMYYMNQQTTNYYNVLVTRIKSVDGYSPNYKLAFIGDAFEDTSFENEWDEIGDVVGAYTYLINTYSRNEYIKDYLGYTFESANEEEMKKLMLNDNVIQMPCYPESGSILVVDHIVVIKLSDTK